MSACIQEAAGRSGIAGPRVDPTDVHSGRDNVAHIDREGFSIIGQLGFIPPGLPLDAVEISHPARIKEFQELTFPIITSSDAHKVNDIGKNFTQFFMEDVTLEEMKKSLLKKDGRKVIISD